MRRTSCISSWGNVHIIFMCAYEFTFSSTVAYSDGLTPFAFRPGFNKVLGTFPEDSGPY